MWSLIDVFEYAGDLSLRVSAFRWAEIERGQEQIRGFFAALRMTTINRTIGPSIIPRDGTWI
jgi:hypothetical protein